MGCQIGLLKHSLEMSSQTNLLKNLHPSKASGKVKARIQRVWTTKYLQRNQIISKDLLLIDSEGGQMHATIQAPHMEKFKGKMQEENIIEMKIFKVKRNRPDYGPIDNDYMIEINNETEMETLTEDDDQFPRHQFMFMDYINLHERKNKTKVLTDVIEVLISMQNATTSKTKFQENTPRRTFVLADECGKEMKVNLWGEIVQQIPNIVEESPEKEFFSL